MLKDKTIPPEEHPKVIIMPPHTDLKKQTEDLSQFLPPQETRSLSASPMAKQATLLAKPDEPQPEIPKELEKDFYKYILNHCDLNEKLS